MSLIIFILLQYFDLATTLLVIDAGGREGNPIVVWLFGIVHNQLAGLIMLKLIACAGGIVIYFWKRYRVLIVLNWFYSAVVLWNLLGLIGYIYY